MRQTTTRIAREFQSGTAEEGSESGATGSGKCRVSLLGERKEGRGSVELPKIWLRPADARGELTEPSQFRHRDWPSRNPIWQATTETTDDDDGLNCLEEPFICARDPAASGNGDPRGR